MSLIWVTMSPQEFWAHLPVTVSLNTLILVRKKLYKLAASGGRRHFLNSHKSLILRFRKDSKLQHLCLELCEIWQASQQQYCWISHQISKCYPDLEYQSCGFIQGTIRCPNCVKSWNRTHTVQALVSSEHNAWLSIFKDCTLNTQLWRRSRKFLLIFLQFYVYELRFKAWGPTTFFKHCPLRPMKIR